MNTAVVNSVDRFGGTSVEDVDLRKFLVYSVILHVFLALWIAVSIYFQFKGEQWSGVGGAEGSVNVKLVGPAAGIPMPSQPSITESKAVDPTKGLYKEEPKPPEPKTSAEKIPDFKKDKPKPISHPSKVDPPKIPPPPNAVDYGKGGSPNLPTSYATNPGGGSGLVTVQGQGGGDFAGRFPGYIESVRHRINLTWNQGDIEPAVRAARRAHSVMTFRIYRDGSVKEIRLLQTSGNLSMDNSAQRTLLNIERFDALPSAFAGPYVDVTFDFDLALTH